MANLRNKTAFPLDSITTYREKPGRGPLTEKLPNMKPRYTMQRNVVPTKVAQPSGGSTRTTNRSGTPTR